MKYRYLKYTLPLAFFPIYRFDRSELSQFWDVIFLFCLLLSGFVLGYKVDKDFKELEGRGSKFRKNEKIDKSE